MGIMNAAETLQIELIETEFRVETGLERLRIFYLDGEKHIRETPNRGKIETRSEKNGNRIVIEQKTEQGAKITESYELSPDGQVMVLRLHMEGRMFNEPVAVRTVYERVNADEAP